MKIFLYISLFFIIFSISYATKPDQVYLSPYPLPDCNDCPELDWVPDEFSCFLEIDGTFCGECWVYIWKKEGFCGSNYTRQIQLRNIFFSRTCTMPQNVIIEVIEKNIIARLSQFFLPLPISFDLEMKRASCTNITSPVPKWKNLQACYYTCCPKTYHIQQINNSYNVQIINNIIPSENCNSTGCVFTCPITIANNSNIYKELTIFSNKDDSILKSLNEKEFTLEITTEELRLINQNNLYIKNIKFFNELGEVFYNFDVNSNSDLTQLNKKLLKNGLNFIQIITNKNIYFDKIIIY